MIGKKKKGIKKKEGFLSEKAAPSAEFGFYSIEKRLGKAEKYLNFENKTILDAGCAQGAYTLELGKKANFAAGIDIQQDVLTIFSRKKDELRMNKIGILNMRIENQGFRDNIFDIVTLIEVLEHVKDETNTLMECKRVLKRKGHIVIYVPNKIFPFETHEVRFFGIRFKRLTPFIAWLPQKVHLRLSTARNYLVKDLKKLMTRCDFEIKAIDYVYPPLDRLGLPLRLKKWYRVAAESIEKTPLRIFGVSIMLIAQKK